MAWCPIETCSLELHNITIISDSQSAHGILTLNWKSGNYFQSINEIKSQINYLKEQGVVVSFNWTPRHASIKETALFSSISSSLWKIIAPDPQGPGLPEHEPSVNATAELDG
jgi:hypothetical protein